MTLAPSSRRDRPPVKPIIRRLPFLLTISALAVGLLIVRNWAYVTTYRLYLSQRVDAASHSAAAQRFDIEDAIVVPQIASRGDDVIAFKAAVGRPSTLHVGVRPSGPVGYEIRWRDGAEVAVLARGEAAAPLTVVRQIPARAGVLELVSHGSITWVDPQLVRDLRVAPHLLAIALLLAGAAATARRQGAHGADSRQRGRSALWYRRLATAGGIAFSLLALEGGLRALGDRVPGGIAAERHDLGEVRKDPRWEDTPRFGRRLRSRVDAVNEWRYGDIVRMGYIPPSVSDGVLHRFAFQTDDEGFRNARVRERIDVAALGDSFTDAMTMRVEDSWPTQLEHETGLAVQNYGTAGFGPQQELLALKDYAARHQPRIVVLAYFAGNDLFDAEAFDDFDAIGRRRSPRGAGMADQRRRQPRRHVVPRQRAARDRHLALEARTGRGAWRHCADRRRPAPDAAARPASDAAAGRRRPASRSIAGCSPPPSTAARCGGRSCRRTSTR